MVWVLSLDGTGEGGRYGGSDDVDVMVCSRG